MGDDSTLMMPAASGFHDDVAIKCSRTYELDADVCYERWMSAKRSAFASLCEPSARRGRGHEVHIAN